MEAHIDPNTSEKLRTKLQAALDTAGADTTLLGRRSQQEREEHIQRIIDEARDVLDTAHRQEHIRLDQHSSDDCNFCNIHGPCSRFSKTCHACGYIAKDIGEKNL